MSKHEADGMNAFISTWLLVKYIINHAFCHSPLREISTSARLMATPPPTEPILLPLLLLSAAAAARRCGVRSVLAPVGSRRRRGRSVGTAHLGGGGGRRRPAHELLRRHPGGSGADVGRYDVRT